jgi:hypothetical protein
MWRYKAYGRRDFSSLVFATLAVLLVGALPGATPRFTSGPYAHTGITSAAKVPDFGKLPLPFEPNVGQADPSTRFLAHWPSGSLNFRPSQVSLTLPTQPEAQSKVAGLSSLEQDHFKSPHPQAISINFLNTDDCASLTAEEPLPGKVNYLLGNDPSRWIANLSTYRTVVYRELYSGISLTYEGTSQQLKGTYLIEPYADPELIRWRYLGADGVNLDEAGNLQVWAEGARGVALTEEAPVAWQDAGEARVRVKVQYDIAKDGSIGFHLGQYDRTRPLVIDPTLIYSSYLGGSADERAGPAVIDRAGNAYIAGGTRSADFPTTPGSFQTAFGGGYGDAFVTKVNAEGTALVYSTYIGGFEGDAAAGIAIDDQENVYITGATTSDNFPLVNPYQPLRRGSDDVFVAKLNATGSRLIYSTYLGGGRSAEYAQSIAVDREGYAYVAGSTLSRDFPVLNAFQPNYGGDYDGFVTKLHPTGSSLVYSTFLGGGSDDEVHDLALHQNGEASLTGYTYSTNFPIMNAIQPTLLISVVGWGTEAMQRQPTRLATRL